MTGSLVSGDLRTRVRELALPLATGLGRLGLTPNGLTLIGFGFAIVAAAAAALQLWSVAGLLVLVGGAFDLLDGLLARATGAASRLGAFMDSVFDRWGESIVYLGVIYAGVTSDFGALALAAAAAMIGAFMVSYTRAKAEGLGFAEGAGMAAVGLAPREVRIVILAAGLGIAACTEPGGFVLGGALVLIAVLATVTTIQRIVHVIRHSDR